MLCCVILVLFVCIEEACLLDLSGRLADVLGAKMERSNPIYYNETLTIDE